jgi:AcrR family transcriptional regulator
LSHRCKEVSVVSDVAILEAALEQLALTGVRRTSADDVARRAGVNRATLYRRFGSREQLLAAA